MAHEEVERIEREFEIWGLKDPFTNLKADENFISRWDKHETYLEFREAYEKRLYNDRDSLKKLTFAECFGEDTKQWKACYDSVATQKRMQRYGDEYPPYFKAQVDKLDKWRELFLKRADFDQEEFVVGSKVMDRIAKHKRVARLDKFLVKHFSILLSHKNDLKEVLSQLETWEDLQPPKLHFDFMTWFTQEEHQ